MKTDMNEIGLELLGMNLRRVNMDFARKKKKKTQVFGGERKKKGRYIFHPPFVRLETLDIDWRYFFSLFLSSSSPLPPSFFFFYSFDSKRKQGTFLGRVIRFFENKIRVDTCEFIDRMQQFV